MSDEEDSMELDRFVVEKCLRCGGDGASMKLLVCSVIGCLIAIHEECTSSQPEIDETGKFYCPYCAHKRALVRTEKLRRKALRAKEVLSMFIMSREVSILGNGGDEGAVRNVGEIEGIGMEADEHVSKGNSEEQCVLERHECDKRIEDNAGDGINQRDGDSARGNEGKSPGEEQMRPEVMEVPESGDFQGGSPVLRKKHYKKRAQRVQVQRVIPLRIVSSPLRKSSSCQTEAVEEDGEKPSEKDTSSSASESRKVSELDHNNEKGNDSVKLSDIPELDQNIKAATSSEFRRSPESNQNEKVTTSCFDLNKVPELDHNEKATINLSSESREIPEPSQNEKATEVLSKSRKVPDSNQNEKTTSSTEPIKVPESGRRRRFNWTADELKMLKEGVQLFSARVNKNIPWRKIFDHGSHVFHKTRTPDNLKDKWKVLCREASDKKQT
ncbi:PREDICTED: uncharacterized protein LOC101295436 [Fragaria vesca subsp. vesca]|uniref:uncharacterized protein LOC101295436 isoform X2 n=1 Tax=Fragaria vesca subsp. vesca TaxID=101020 RepID=UPI0002C325A6|nr:PREDICTED: uncharacterized protein LOC101295436 isoform X2 [Fragaria vesca subsp. vesca]